MTSGLKSSFVPPSGSTTAINTPTRDALQFCFYTVRTTGQAEKSASGMRLLPSASGPLRWQITLWPVCYQQGGMQQAFTASTLTSTSEPTSTLFLVWKSGRTAVSPIQFPTPPACTSLHPKSDCREPASEAPIKFTADSIHTSCCRRSSFTALGLIRGLYLPSE